MLATRRRPTTDDGRRTNRRRGVTLVEMLVTVAVLVIIMTILVQIFQAATGSVSAAQAFQQLDDQLRRLDGMIRGDLEGVTARFTPPLDPEQNLGYFEYGENEFADIQGEDSDDYIRFTAKAPVGRPFTGRFWPQYWTNPIGATTFGANAANMSSFPITITSDYAEIIYFVRNGNLYRRVLLVAPELQSAVFSTYSNPSGNPSAYNVGYDTSGTAHTFQPSIFGGGTAVSWQGVNDLSARPNATGPNFNAGSTAQDIAQGAIVLNTLGDLTNRENRFAYSRFANDFFNADPSSGKENTPDGIPDDWNGGFPDNVPDLYPSLYPGIFPPRAGGTGPPFDSVRGVGKRLIFEPNFGNWVRQGLGTMAFPFVFPGAYSKAQAVSNDHYGWIHAPAPYAFDATGKNRYQFDLQTALYLHNLNHNPLDLGDNLPQPPNALAGNLQGAGSDYQTWWGFPTWRETLSPTWTDPTQQVNVAGHPPVLNPLTAQEVSRGHLDQSGTTRLFLPPMDLTSGFRANPQLFCDGWGNNATIFPSPAGLWAAGWEDDLIMTGVRSFDVKAYDNALSAYADLGWGDDLRVSNFGSPLFLTGNQDYSPQWTNGNPVYPPQVLIQNNHVDYINQTFAHEGRMPPLVADNRLDAQNPNPYYLTPAPAQTPPNIPNPLPSGFIPQYYPTYPDYSSNIGDDNTGIVRLRRVWDSWSTEYSRAPATGVGPSTTGGFPVGPPFSPPVYPSYPPPYPAPLRGIQIQIRVVDPTNQRIKSLTIRQDFTDKL